MLLVPRKEIIQNVFIITPDPNVYGPGSCFGYASGGLLYLITAGHVIKSLPHAVEAKLFIYTSNKWEEIKVIPYFASGRSYIDNNGDVDIAVIKTSIQAKSNLEIDLSNAGCVFGQDVYFLGFPYVGSRIPYLANPINNGKPLPLVKKATLSSMPMEESPYFFLDGHNNPGFSGGPVTFWDDKTNKQKVLGVVHGYLPHCGSFSQIEATSSPSVSYLENSGIAIAYNIRYAKDIINELSS